MTYVQSVAGAWTNRDGDGDRMRIIVDFHATEWPYNPDTGGVGIQCSVFVEYDLGTGDSISDSNYSFNSGGGWGDYSGMKGAISGSANAGGTVLKHMYDSGIGWYNPQVGSTYNVQVWANHSGVDKIGGQTAYFDYWFSYMAKPYHVPNQGSVTNLRRSPDRLTVGGDFTGKQLNAGQDRFWESLDFTIFRSSTGEWSETHGADRNTTGNDWTLAPDSYASFSVRGRNATGVGEWAPFKMMYSRPHSPRMDAAARLASDRSTVQINYSQLSAHVAATYLHRRAKPTDPWVHVGTSTNGVFQVSQPISSTFEYMMQAATPADSAGVVWSDPSNMMTVGAGYAAPDQPTNLTISNVSSQLRTTFSGNQVNPALDKYWEYLRFHLFSSEDGYTYLGQEDDETKSSFTSTGLNLQPDRRYALAIEVYNSGGNSAPKLSPWYYTTPDAPTELVAERVGGVGGEVNLSWVNNAAYATEFVIYRSLDGAPYEEHARVSGSTTTWTGFVPVTSRARFYVIAVAGTATSLRSNLSQELLSSEPDLSRIPGVVKIYYGATKVYRVMRGSEQIWLG